MSNYNMSAIKKIVNNLGIECQLVAGANPLTCKYVIIQGKQLKSSAWTKAEAEAVLTSYKEGDCKKSMLDISLTLESTNKSNIKDLILFENNSLTYCLEEFRKLTESSNINKVKSWVNTMTDFFTNETSNKTDVDACANKIKNMFDTKQIRVINNYIYSTLELTNIIKTWQDVNNIKQDINYNTVIDKYINAVENLL